MSKKVIYNRIAGIDPGVATGGMVILDRSDRERVLGAFYLGERSGAITQAKSATAEYVTRAFGGWSDKEFLSVVLRAQAWIDNLSVVLDEFEREHGKVDIFAVESFVDQAQHAKTMMKNRWHTPLVMGILLSLLEKRGYTPINGLVIFQNAGIVLKQRSEEIARLKARSKNDRDLIVPGDRLVTNDHQRSAFAHARALAMRIPSMSPQPILP